MSGDVEEVPLTLGVRYRVLYLTSVLQAGDVVEGIPGREVLGSRLVQGPEEAVLRLHLVLDPPALCLPVVSPRRRDSGRGGPVAGPLVGRRLGQRSDPGSSTKGRGLTGLARDPCARLFYQCTNGSTSITRSTFSICCHLCLFSIKVLYYSRDFLYFPVTLSVHL